MFLAKISAVEGKVNVSSPVVCKVTGHTCEMRQKRAPGSEAAAEILAKTRCKCCHFESKWTSASSGCHRSTETHSVFIVLFVWLFFFNVGVFGRDRTFIGRNSFLSSSSRTVNQSLYRHLL